MRIRVNVALGFIAGVLLVLPHGARAQQGPRPGAPPDERPGGPVAPPPLLLPSTAPPPQLVLTEPRTIDTTEEAPVEARGFDRARIAVGYRASFVRDPTFDAFARSGLLGQLSLDATYGFVRAGRFALASGLAWDFGSLSGLYDGYDVSLQVHRFTVPLEARYVLTPWLYGFGRAAPGLGLYNARVNALGAPLEGGPWVPAADFSGGVSILLGPHSAARTDVARVWLTPEVGYGWAAEREVDLEARRGQPVVEAGAPQNLGALSVRGVFVRAAIGLTL